MRKPHNHQNHVDVVENFSRDRPPQLNQTIVPEVPSGNDDGSDGDNHPRSPDLLGAFAAMTVFDRPYEREDNYDPAHQPPTVSTAQTWVSDSTPPVDHDETMLQPAARRQQPPPQQQVARPTLALLKRQPAPYVPGNLPAWAVAAAPPYAHYLQPPARRASSLGADDGSKASSPSRPPREPRRRSTRGSDEGGRRARRDDMTRFGGAGFDDDVDPQDYPGELDDDEL